MIIVDYMLIVAFFAVLAVLLFFVATGSNTLAHKEDMQEPWSELHDEHLATMQPDRLISYIILAGLFAFFIVTAWLTGKPDKHPS